MLDKLWMRTLCILEKWQQELLKQSLTGLREEKCNERQGSFENMLFQSMYTAPCQLNQRSCTWTITTSEPCLADICIYWVTGVSLTQTLSGWIAECDVIYVEQVNIKCLSQIIFSHISMVIVGRRFWNSILNLTWSYSNLVKVDVENVTALCVLVWKWTHQGTYDGIMWIH